MVKISLSPSKNNSFPKTWLPFVILSLHLLSSVKPAPLSSTDFLSKTPRLLFKIKSSDKRVHSEHSSFTNKCSTLPEKVQYNWSKTIVELNSGVSTENEERCVIFFSDKLCNVPTLVLNYNTEPTFFHGPVRRYRYCKSSCDLCPGGVPTPPTTTDTPDYSGAK